MIMSENCSVSSTDMSFWGKVTGTSSAVVAALHRSSWSWWSIVALPPVGCGGGCCTGGTSTISVLASVVSATFGLSPPARLARAEAAASKEERRRITLVSLFMLLLILSFNVL